MVLQVGADAGDVEQRADAGRLQVIGRSHARQHQQLRRVHRAAAQDDLHLCACDLVAAVDDVAHAHRVVLVEDDALDQRAGDDVHVVLVALDRGPQVGAGGAPALLALLRHLVLADAFLHGAVEVGEALVAGLLGGLHERLADLGRVGLVGDVQRPAGAVERVGAALVVLGLLEERQHVLVAPALVAELAPVVVVPGVAAHIEHGVDRRRAAERLAARPVHAPVVAMDLRHGLVAPVVGRLFAEAGEARRHLQQEGRIGRAGLEDQDAQPVVLAQAIGDRAAGRAGADDDVVVGIVEAHVPS